MRVTKWTEYGIILLQSLAREEDGKPVSARSLAARETLSVDFAEQVLLKLRRAGIVQSIRGARGGYILSVEPSAIVLSMVFAALESDAFVLPDCRVAGVMMALQKTMASVLEGMTLADSLLTAAR